MTIKNNIQAIQLLDESPKDYKKPEDILGESGLLKQLTRAIMERAFPAELTHHLGCNKARSVRQQLAQRRKRHDPEDRPHCKEFLRASVRDRLLEVCYP